MGVRQGARQGRAPLTGAAHAGMGRAEPSHLVVGHVIKPHGIRGELSVSPLTDHPGTSFASGVELLPGDEEGREPDPAAPPLTVEWVRPFRQGWLVKFEGVDDRDVAERLRGRYLLRPLEALEELAEDEVFYHQLLDMEVVTPEGRSLGRIVEVYELSPVDLLEVRGEDRTFHVPFLRSIVREVDVAAKRMVIDPPEGLLEL